MLVCCLTAGRREKAGRQLSHAFEREGDLWQLRLDPIAEDRNVGLYLKLLAEDKPADYSVERCFSLRVLHPTDADRSQWTPCLQPDRFHREPNSWGFDSFLSKAEVSSFSHKGMVTLQAVVWKPPIAAAAAPAAQPPHPTEVKEEPPSCAVCYSNPPSVLLRCCNTVRTCGECIDRVLNERRLRCPLCREHIDDSRVIRGLRM